MNTLIAQKNIQEKDVVVIPRQEYEYLINFKKIKEFSPTLAQKNHWFAQKIILRKKDFYPNELVQKAGICKLIPVF